ncbi:MAG: S41 family peptidase [Clostridia bacterium]|nr:S41 family peptidase [Clostridia bacterium]
MLDNNLNEEIRKAEQKEETKNKIIIYTTSFTLAIVFSAFILFALYTVFIKGNNVATSKIFTQEQMERLEYAASLIDKNYLYEYDTDAMIDGAISGMVKGLGNKFTYYQTEEEYQESLQSGKSDYVGIGVHLTYDEETDVIRVLGTMPNSPAEKAGVMGGDLIFQVDDLMITEDTYFEGVNNIRGEEGTDVKLRVKRGDEILEFTITRQKIQENNVTSEIIDGIGYIRIFAFDNDIYKQFRTAYDEIANQGISGLVIDLRNNPGGYVDDTLKILDMFVGQEDVLRLVDKNGKEKVFSTTDAENINIPLAVIVNQNSASASEIFASIVMDLNRGEVFGTQTYGKGVVQYVLRIKDHGSIDCVAAQYFTPSGVVIQDNGITPTHVVEVDEEYKNNTFIPRDKDAQLQGALEYIKNKK